MAPLLTLCCASPSFADDSRILDKALDARRGLSQSYHLVLNVTYTRPNVGDKQVAKVEVWNKGKLSRCDETKSESNFDVAGVNTRSVVCRNCERAGFGIMTRVGQVGTISEVSFIPIDSPSLVASDPFRFDWRRLGQLDGSIYDYVQRPADSTIRFYRDRNPDVSETRKGESVIYTTAVALKLGSSMQATFDPRVGMNPVNYVTTNDTSKYISTTEITYQTTSAGLWYPKTVSHVRTHRGEVTVDEKIDVVRADFNVDVPDSVFSLEGLTLDFGQPVALPEIKESYKQPTWGKGKLDYKNTVGTQSLAHYRATLAESLPPPVPESRISISKPYYLAGAAILVVSAVVMLVFARRRQS